MRPVNGIYFAGVLCSCWKQTIGSGQEGVARRLYKVEDENLERVDISSHDLEKSSREMPLAIGSVAQIFIAYNDSELTNETKSLIRECLLCFGLFEFDALSHERCY